MPENFIYFDNQFYQEKEASLLALDRGLLFGDGVFESFKALSTDSTRTSSEPQSNSSPQAGSGQATQERILGLEHHLQRLLEGMKILQIEPRWTSDELKTIIESILQKSALSEAYVRVNVTRGKWMGSIPPIVSSKPTLVIHCRKFLPFREELYERGYRTLTLSIRRNESSPLCQIKSLNYLDNILGRMQALEKGLDEGIFLNTQGRLAEGAASNVFLVKKDKLLTPSPEEGVLAGVTRRLILENAERLGLETETGPLAPKEISAAGEAFLTNSLMGVIPWVGHDGKEIGSGKPGPITQKIRKFYNSL